MKITRLPIYRLVLFTFLSVCLGWFGIFLSGMFDAQRLTTAAERSAEPLQPAVLISCKRIDLYETDIGSSRSPEHLNRSVKITDANFERVRDWLKKNIVDNPGYHEQRATTDTVADDLTYLVLYSAVGAGASQKLMMQLGMPMMPLGDGGDKKVLKVLPLKPGCFGSYEQHMMELRQLMLPMNEAIPMPPLR